MNKREWTAACKAVRLDLMPWRHSFMLIFLLAWQTQTVIHSFSLSFCSPEGLFGTHGCVLFYKFMTLSGNEGRARLGSSQSEALPDGVQRPRREQVHPSSALWCSNPSPGRDSSRVSAGQTPPLLRTPLIFVCAATSALLLELNCESMEKHWGWTKN